MNCYIVRKVCNICIGVQGSHLVGSQPRRRSIVTGYVIPEIAEAVTVSLHHLEDVKEQIKMA